MILLLSAFKTDYVKEFLTPPTEEQHTHSEVDKAAVVCSCLTALIL